MDDKQVPGFPRCVVATPSDASMLVLGGHEYTGVSFTRDQHRRLMAFYGYSEAETGRAVEEARAAHEARLAAARAKAETASPWEARTPLPQPFEADSVRRLFVEGAAVNIYRRVARDGLRLMAFLSSFVERGEDPVRFVARLCADAGLDVCVNIDWIDGVDDSNPDPAAEQFGACPDESASPTADPTRGEAP